MFATLRRAWILGRLSSVLGQEFSSQKLLQHVLSGSNPKDDALERLLDIVTASEDCATVMKHHGATRDNLRQLYQELAMVGAGQWVNGRWPPVVALAWPKALNRMLQATADGVSALDRASGLLNMVRERTFI
jgi:hypothetical protein